MECLFSYRFVLIKNQIGYYRKHIIFITLYIRLYEKKKILIKKAYDEVDKYYYTIKYGKIFSFLNNFYIFRIRFILSNPSIVFKKLIRKLIRKFSNN